jgi:hypothetical protein
VKYYVGVLTLSKYMKIEGFLIIRKMWAFAGIHFPLKYGLMFSLRSFWVETLCIYEKTQIFESLVHKMTVIVCHMY